MANPFPQLWGHLRVMNIDFYDDTYVLVEGVVWNNEPSIKRVYLNIEKQEIDITGLLDSESRDRIYERLLSIYDRQGGHREDLKDREWEFE